MSESDRTVVSRNSNTLLAGMPDAEWDKIRAALVPVELAAHQVLCGRRETLQYVYFPRRGYISLVVDFADGFQAEVGVVGYEGMVGLPLIGGVTTDIVAAVVQAPSEALRMPAAIFLRELEQMPVFGRLLLRYGEAMRGQAMQLAACNGHHSLDARLARCLLTMQDLQRANELPVTHELLATLLSAHRPSISVAAKRLQQAGTIRYSAGHLMITDRPGLEHASCECYAAIRDHTQAVFGATPPTR